MLNFYIVMLSIYSFVVACLFYNTRQNALISSKSEELQKRKLVNHICTNHLMFININVGLIIIIQLYATWCAVSILKIFSICKFDTIFGIVITSVVLCLILIKRIVMISVVSKSVLYL